MELISAKTILSGYTADNPWFGCNYNMNIYKGCSHGCIYCDSRSECYRIDDFHRVRAKRNALDIIERELKSKRKSGVVGTGAMSDPYNPCEKEHLLTRGALQLINRYNFGVAIATKSSLILRDTDILKKINSHSPVLIKITITAADDTLCKMVEPMAPPSSERFEALRELSRAGIYAGILLMPVLPFIEDNEENIKAIVAKAHDCGAKFIYPGFGVTLRQNQRAYYYKKLDELFPGLKNRYIQQFGNSYSCASPSTQALWKCFASECEHRGMRYKMKDIISDYRIERSSPQISFFDL